ncbi:hypothetical protein AB0M87_26400 [Streptomyces sp. NPDC051320]|uniref:hypothetical protein n=1 Tax=Streptomyces sp. NPDC051320 TaxID=3154644 RepID=UPI00342A4AF8
MTVVDFSHGGDDAATAHGTLRGVLQSRGSEWCGTVLDVPCGKAAIFTGGQSYTLPANLSHVGEEVEVPTAQFHAIIPVPNTISVDNERMCLVAFSTPSIQHWEERYAPVMADVLRSLRFTDVPSETHEDARAALDPTA